MHSAFCAQGFASECCLPLYVVSSALLNGEITQKNVKPYAPWNKVFVSVVTFLCWKKPSNNGS